MQALRAAQRGRHRLDRGAHNIIVRILLGQRNAAGLAVGAQHLGLWVGRAKFIHDVMPQLARGAQLGDFHEEVHADAPEKAEARRKAVHRQPLGHGGANIFHAIGQRIGQLLHRRRTGFMHMIAADRDRVETRHMLSGIADDVRHDPHARFWRIDIGVADHELLQNIVLNGSGQQLLIDALLLGRDDVEGEHRQHRAVHGHGNRHLVERDLVEQNFHVRQRVDGDTGFAHVPGHPWVIAVIAAMGRQIERDRQALLPGGQIATIEGVGLLGRGKARILADRPGPPGIHRGIGPARIRLETRQARIDRVRAGVERLDGDALGRLAREFAALHLFVGAGFPVVIGRCVSHEPSSIRSNLACRSLVLPCRRRAHLIPARSP